MINMSKEVQDKFIKENIVYILLLVIILGGGLYFTFTAGMNAYNSISQLNEKNQNKQTKEKKLKNLKDKRIEEENNKEVRKSTSGKLVYEVPKFQFSPEASFGIMFENILTNITNSGVRVRSIDYNYSPSDDRILGANVPGYNACELSFVTVGTYTQLQTFFKNIAKEKYLSSLYEIYIEPYDNNKTILIAKFKIRLYTKSV